MLQVFLRESSETDPHYKGRHKLTESMRKRLASSAKCAIITRSKDAAEKNSGHATAAKHLQEDILNCALHCFGSHHKCKADYCKTVQQLNIVQQSATTTPTSDSLAAMDASFIDDIFFFGHYCIFCYPI